MQYTMEELVPVVAWLSEKYTSGESTSITYEKAQQLMEAVIFCINEQGVSEKNEVSEIYVSLDAMTAYKLGYERVIEKVYKAKSIYDEMLKIFDDYGNWAYRDTIIKGMPKFFTYYDPRFAPQEQILTLDYPAMKPLGELKGIDAIYYYLELILQEQRFLNRIPREYIIETLEKYHDNYEELFINVCEVVMEE